jgi:hypothetical protein
MAALLCCSLTAFAAAAERKLEARLIWGTNAEKSPNPSHKTLEGEMAKKLQQMPFKWKNYFEVSRQNFAIPVSSPKKVKMSENCEIEVQNLGNSSIEVKLYGQGKMVVRKTQKIKPNELLVLAGDDKNDTAWFVVMSLAEK